MERLPKASIDLIGEQEPAISPMAVLELSYLHEVGRARDPLPVMLNALKHDIGLEVADVSLAELIAVASDLTWTRDPFDRLIAAHAIVVGAPLVTADRTILEHLPLAVWD